MIKAIETVYKGYRFRSRLEARWAVFFDTLGLKYQYESEGFDLGELGWYLPDFWLPDWGCWVEIKPDLPPALESEVREYRLCEKLAELSGKVVLFIGGQPWVGERYSDTSSGRAIYLTDSVEYSIAIFSPKMLTRIAWPTNHPDIIEFLPLADRFHHTGLTEDFFCLISSFYGFIWQAYQDHPKCFDTLPSRGDIKALIEADKTYFQRRHNKEHWRWRYGMAYNGLYFDYDWVDRKVYLEVDYHTTYNCPNKLYRSFLAARGARFEHGEKPLIKTPA